MAWKNDGIDWLSPSKISTYLQCPLKYKWSYIDKKPQKPAPQLTKGNFVHSILEGLFDLPAEERTLASAKVLARKYWDDQYAAEAEELNLGEDGLRQFRWESWWCVDNYFKLEDPATVSPEGMERWVKGPIGSGMVRGKVDRVDRTEDGLVPIDYKTGKKPGKPEWEVGHIFQLNTYAILLENELNEPVPQVINFYLGDGNKVAHDITDESKASCTKTVTSVREGINEDIASGNFKTIKSKLCDWCDFKPECPAWS